MTSHDPMVASRSLYIHIPFCLSKCPYCSFSSVALEDHLIAPYLKALEKEAASYHGTTIKTVYVGGGTPTYLGTEELEHLGKIIHAHFRWAAQAEFTVEANPATFDESKAKCLRRIGANRASLGVQSLQDKSLKWLGRPHTRAEALEGFRILRRAGFENINVDLIYALPGQTLAELDQEVSDILSLQSEHISLYTLSVSEGSRFFTQGTFTPDPDQQDEYYRRVTQRLVEESLEHYEVSNFARPGFACQHNQHYWEAGDYIGLGASAHSHQQGRRSWNVANPADYIDKMTRVGSALEGQEVLTPAQRFMEALLIGLRLTQGIDMASLARRFSTAVPADVASRIDAFVAEGLLCKKGDRLRASLAGLVVLDEICSRLI